MYEVAFTTVHTAMMRRLGLNRAEVMGALKNDMVGSIDSRAPLRVVKYTEFKEHGRIPRSNEEMTKKLSEVPGDAMLGFISHRWLRPWHNKEDCEANGHTWGGMAHPDDSVGTKHRLICDGMEKLAEAKGWDIDKVYLWIDFAGVEQDNEELLKAGVASLRGYITLCDAVLIPSPAVPEGTLRTVDMVPGGYGERGWTRLEAMSMYAVSALKQVEAPEIWVAAGDGASFLERFDYVLKELPSDGVLFSEADREYIRGHETAFIEQMKQAVIRNGYIARHTEAVSCVAFDPKDQDGDLVASGGKDGVIKLVNRHTGTTVWTVETKTRVHSLAFSRDGTLLAAGGDDKMVRIWTVGAGTRPVEKCSLRGHSRYVTSVAFSPDSSALASASADETVKLWDLSGDAPVKQGTLRGHSGEVNCVAFSLVGSLLASASKDSTVKLWDPTTMEEKGTLKGHSNVVSCVAWNHDGSLLASSSWDETVKLWDPRTMEEKGTLNWPQKSKGLFQRFKGWLKGDDPRPNGDDPRLVGTLKGHSDLVTCVAWNKDGSVLASSSWDKTVKLWDPRTMEEKGTLKGHSEGVSCIAWNNDGSLFASSSWDRTVKLWDSTTIEEKGTLNINGKLITILKGHSDSVYCVAWNHDGSLLASGSGDKTVRLWTPDGEEKGTLTEHRGDRGDVSCVAFSPDSSLLVSASENDRMVKLWDPTTMEEKGILWGHSWRVYCVAWNHDGSLLASGSRDGTVRLWTPDGEEKGTLRGHDCTGDCICKKENEGFSGEKLVVNEKCPVRGHSRDNPECTCRHYENQSFAGRWEVDVSAECSAKGHSDSVISVVWNHDGLLLASGSRDGTVKLWDLSGDAPVQRGTLKGTVASWQGLDPKTKELAAKVKEGGSAGSNRTGQYVVTAGGDMVYVYRTDPDGMKQVEPLACFRSPANVRSISCWGTKVVAGCHDGQVVFLEAPLLAGVQ